MDKRHKECDFSTIENHIPWHGMGLDPLVSRKNEQLFVCFGPPNKRCPASKQRMSKWVDRGHLTCLGIGRSTFSYGCPVSIDQEYGGLQGPDIRSCSPRGLWCGRMVLTAHIRFYYLDVDSTPRLPGAFVLVLLAWFQTGQALVAMVTLYWRSRSISDATDFLLKGTFGYDCNLGSLKRERTLCPRPYLLRACKWLAQTF